MNMVQTSSDEYFMGDIMNNTVEKNNNFCVYYKKQRGLRFDKQEHIFPAFIGGIKKLDQGIVSDEVNELFSGMEKHVSMESLINIERMFCGPGKRGSRNPKKQGNPKIGVMCLEDGGVSLGYIVLGKPKQIIQCFLDTDTGGSELKMLMDASEKENAGKVAEEFIEELKSFKVEDAICLTDPRISENSKILGNHKGKWFLAYNPEREKSVVEKEVSAFIQKLEDKKYASENPEECRVSREQLRFNFRYAMDMNKYFRFHAKIAFNVSTYLNGREFMLNECFDGIRRAILSGDRIKEYVWILPENPLAGLEDYNYKDKYGKHVHSVVCCQRKKEYYAFVSLYGVVACVMVKLTDCLDVRPTRATDGFFCDWENRKEYRMWEFLSGLV